MQFSGLLVPTLAFVASASAVPSCLEQSLTLTELGANDIFFQSQVQEIDPIHNFELATVNFRLENPVLDQDTACEGDSMFSPPWFFPGISFECSENIDGEIATFIYDRGGGQLSVNQTWVCPDDGSTFSAMASNANLPAPVCVENRTENPLSDVAVCDAFSVTLTINSLIRLA